MHSSDTLLGKKIFEEIRLLEESLWRAETRFDTTLMDDIFAQDFLNLAAQSAPVPAMKCYSIPKIHSATTGL